MTRGWPAESREGPPGGAAVPASDRSRSIYREPYVGLYPSLYLAPWRRKHELNAANLNRILSGLRPSQPRWLDLACGQAWHFSVLAGRARMFGLDLSEAQLQRARASAPHARFILGDMADAPFAPASFDLVSNFWAGYCYLRNRARIAALVRAAVQWISPGGALYFEVLLGRNLASFNQSTYARRTTFAVTPLSDDFAEWRYDDAGGRHLMTSPPLDDFLDVVSPEFASVEARHDGGFMYHLVATGRR
ncbi:MAG: class I SAM-dependent methyltransferase [Bryobacteraceae bacterium]